MFVLLFIDFFPNSIWFWFPVIFVLTFSANYLRTKGWWGTALYILAFLTWVPAVFLPYNYQDAYHDWTCVVANLMAFGVFLSVGERVDSREWASRALHRLMALFQASVVSLFLFVVYAICDLKHRTGDADWCFWGIFSICGLILCWRLWAKPKTSKRREVILKVMETLLSVANIVLVAWAYFMSVRIFLIGNPLTFEIIRLFSIYQMLGLGLLVRDARGDQMPSWTLWFYRYLPLIMLPMLALLWYSTLISISLFGWCEHSVALLLMTGMITIFQFMALIRRPLSLRATMYLSMLAVVLALFAYFPGMKEIFLRSQISRYQSLLPILKEKGVFSEDAPDCDAVYADPELADALEKAKATMNYFYRYSPSEYDFICGNEAKKIEKYKNCENRRKWLR